MECCANSRLLSMPLNLELISLSAALLLAATAWPVLAQAARRREPAARRGGQVSTALLGFLGPAAMTAAGMALLVVARFL
jgi:hypothetical protein